MGQDKILNLFFEEQNRIFKIREIARITKIPKTTVARELKELVKEKLIKKKQDNVLGYVANESDSYFRLCKKIKFLGIIYRSGLVTYLDEQFNPQCIILFGSFSKGEYNKNSDIDIFIQAKEKGYNLARFEKNLKHNINLFFDEKLSNLSNELFNNVINGIKLVGYIKLK